MDHNKIKRVGKDRKTKAKKKKKTFELYGKYKMNRVPTSTSKNVPKKIAV
jgi:hypothetical protein